MHNDIAIHESENNDMTDNIDYTKVYASKTSEEIVKTIPTMHFTYFFQEMTELDWVEKVFYMDGHIVWMDKAGCIDSNII